MAHDHDHAHEGPAYFLDQICSIILCSLIALAALLQYKSGRLGLILAPMFHPYVLVGGVVLFVLVMLRMISLWDEAAEARNRAATHTHDHDHKHDHDHTHTHDHAHDHKHDHKHDHDHVHDENCNHDHDHAHDHKHDHKHDHAHDHKHDHAHSHAHDHDHDGHDHGVAPWRYMLLALPVIMFFLSLPNSGFSMAYLARSLGETQELEASSGPVEKKDGLVLGFKELDNARYTQTSRDFFEGQTANLKGKFSAVTDKEFTLFRMRMTCCAADAIPLKVRIMSPEPLLYTSGEWVEIAGPITFRKVAGTEEFVPVIMLESGDKVKPTRPENDYE